MKNEERNGGFWNGAQDVALGVLQHVAFIAGCVMSYSDQKYAMFLVLTAVYVLLQRKMK